MLWPRFRRRIVYGRLTVIDPDGVAHELAGPRPGHGATVRLHARRIEPRLLVQPSLTVGEAYMDGTLTLEEGTLYDLLAFCVQNLNEQPSLAQLVARWPLLRWAKDVQQHNPLQRARRNVAHHYELSDELFDLFLDAERQYSCGYFRTPNDDLDTAQRAKMAHIAAKLVLEDGHEVLDIGSGWGGLGLELARQANVRVTGCTLSASQQRRAQQRAEHERLSDRVAFELSDYREQAGSFDRIVSVGMFEHVGVKHYDEFFCKIAELLRPDGVALLHSIGRAGPPSVADPWFRKYIFPGAYIPALSEVLPVVERAGLWVTDIEILRLHYAETLRRWRSRFQAHWSTAAGLYDERFCRMWNFYLTAAEVAFRWGEMMVFQMQLAKRRDAVPLTRDYVARREREAERAAAAE